MRRSQYSGVGMWWRRFPRVVFFGSMLTAWGVANGGAAETATQEVTTSPTVQIAVVDEDGKPIEGAVVKPWGLATRSSHGAWWPERGGKPVMLATDAAGKVELEYPRFRLEHVPVTAVSVLVKHPGYSPVSLARVPVDCTPPSIVLLKAATLRIHAHSKTRAIDSNRIVVQIGGEGSGIEMDDWSRLADGGIELATFPPETRTIRAVFMPESGPFLFSDLVMVEAETGGVCELSLELKPGVPIKGRLDETVPRPVKNGWTVARSTPRGAGEDPKRIDWQLSADVLEDGTFEMDSFPEGEGEILAICDGYVSKNPPEWKPGRLRQPQRFDIRSPVDPVEVAMEPAATCEVTVLDDRGNPVTGAEVLLGPNAHWGVRSDGRGDFTTLFAGRSADPREVIGNRGPADREKMQREPSWHNFRAHSDAAGVAVISNLPAGRDSVGVFHDAYELPVDDSSLPTRRRVTVELVSGETTRITVRMQEKGTEFLGDQ